MTKNGRKFKERSCVMCQETYTPRGTRQKRCVKCSARVQYERYMSQIDREKNKWADLYLRWIDNRDPHKKYSLEGAKYLFEDDPY